ncbi:hypothetical protein BASA81_009563 [Batrachochytrium salamandrivorans]|nr:hypothetical protein BASA81_009563 [Batrachochytrium salamandrivorans]
MRMHILWGWIWTALEHAGFISPAPITSVAVSLILCVTLFLGPLIMEGAEIYALVQQTISQPDDHLMAIRAWIVGPIVEEVVFRGYMVPLMIAGGFSVHQIIWYLPLFFGPIFTMPGKTIRDHGYTRSAVLKAITLSGFQLIYTSIFGWLATYLFIRTGSIYCPLSAHVFCNIMGFPDLGRLVDGTLFQQGRNVEAMCEVVMMIE